MYSHYNAAIADEFVGFSNDSLAELNEAQKTNLPYMYETVLTGIRIKKGMQAAHKPLGVRPPLPGKYTKRPGNRLDASQLIPLVNEWLAQSDSARRFVIQGGNRYISQYLENNTIDAMDVKVMSINKVPLCVQLITLLKPSERQELLHETTLYELGFNTPVTREEALSRVASYVLESPFSTVTHDHTLESELAVAVDSINKGSIEILNNDLLRIILEGTDLAVRLNGENKLAFIDDLFYRGRTLYSLAVIVQAFGGNIKNIQLTTIACDQLSTTLESTYHTVLAKNVLYPFENSIRTEQGYWQDIGDMYVFTDMGNYWEYLYEKVGQKDLKEVYVLWERKLEAWIDQYMKDAALIDHTLVNPLLWLRVYANAYGIELRNDKIVDQKGYMLGVSVPFARLIDRFISQEEPVEARLLFKAQIIEILSSIDDVLMTSPETLEGLTAFYLEHQYGLDFQGLDFMFNDEQQPIMDLRN